MPNLINVDDDNVFFNYRTPLLFGEGALATPSNFRLWAEQALGVNNVSTNSWGNFIAIRFPAPEFENKTTAIGTISSANGNGFSRATFNHEIQGSAINTSNNSNSLIALESGPLGGSGSGITGQVYGFGCMNSYALCYAQFNASLGYINFRYLGWLRESQFTGANAIRGFVHKTERFDIFQRVTTENLAGITPLSTANNSITNPPITCGGDASDIVVRDVDAPNYAIGKLWNCVSLPNSAVVGQIWKNTGSDPDGYTKTNNNDKYLVVRAWGGRKLGMRIWTEGFV